MRSFSFWNSSFWLTFFSVDFLFLSILISFSYNFRAMKVISKKNQNGESVMAVIRTNGLIWRHNWQVTILSCRVNSGLSVEGEKRLKYRNTTKTHWRGFISPPPPTHLHTQTHTHTNKHTHTHPCRHGRGMTPRIKIKRLREKKRCYCCFRNKIMFYLLKIVWNLC